MSVGASAFISFIWLSSTEKNLIYRYILVNRYDFLKNYADSEYFSIGFTQTLEKLLIGSFGSGWNHYITLPKETHVRHPILNPVYSPNLPNL